MSGVLEELNENVKKLVAILSAGIAATVTPAAPVQELLPRTAETPAAAAPAAAAPRRGRGRPPKDETPAPAPAPAAAPEVEEDPFDRPSAPAAPAAASEKKYEKADARNALNEARARLVAEKQKQGLDQKAADNFVTLFIKNWMKDVTGTDNLTTLPEAHYGTVAVGAAKLKIS